LAVILKNMPFSTEELRKALAGQQWTSHNIRLNADCTTMPGQPDFMETDLRLHAILRVLDMIYGENLGGLRVADLGCCEGGFSLALAQRGADVVGIEARHLNVEKANLLRDHFGLKHLRFDVADVKDFAADAHGQFDVVLALGILYHLDQPAQWLRRVADATRRVLIIDTHFAPADDAAMSKLDPRLSALGPLEDADVKDWKPKGRWFHEFDESADRESQLWASYSNSRSFWLTKQSLLQSIQRAGFSLVFEQHDYSMDNFELFSVAYPRCMLVAIRK
jgi:SAM-dependent methyltransferase